MDCTAANLTVRSTPEFLDAGAMGVSLPLENVRLSGPSLMLSDDPETVSGPAEGALWWQQLPDGDGGDVAGEHSSRVFLWHVNATGADRRIGLTLENTGAQPLTIKRLRGQVSATDQFLEHGRCVAVALVAGTLDPLPISHLVVQPGEIVLLHELPWPRKRLVGGEYELTVAEPASSYVLRTVQCRTTTDPRKFRGAAGTPLPTNATHPRGCWSGSEISLDVNFSIPASGPVPTTCIRLADAANQSEDCVFLAAQCSPQPGPAQTVLDNKANFGALYRTLRLFIDNASPQSVQLEFLLVPRGGELAGAIRSTSLVPTPLGFQGLDIGAGPGSNPICHSAVLGTLTLPASQSHQEEFTLAVAGASNTPFAFVLSPAGAAPFAPIP